MSQDLAAAPQGLLAVRQMFDRSLCRMRYDLGDNRAPWSVAYFGGVELPGIAIYRDEAIGYRRVVRDRIDVSEDPSGDFILAMPLSAAIEHRQAGSLTRCQPGQAVLFATGQPFASTISALRRGARYSQILLRISADLLSQRDPTLALCPQRMLDVQRGAGTRFKALSELALAEAGDLPATQRQALGSLLLDALADAAACTRSLVVSRVDTGDGERSLERVRRSALRYIDAELADPQLDVTRIARHCGVSPRYLHAAFSTEGLRVGAHIREQRLLRCRAELRDPRRRDRPILDIALSWGFCEAAHFSRLYKQRFGRSPRAERRDGSR